MSGPSPDAIARWWVDEEEQRLADAFEASSLPVAARLDTFPRYVTRSWLARFLCLHELYKLIRPVKGAIVDGGVFWGFSFMSFLRLRAMYEARRDDRIVYGFDSFAGFPGTSEEDRMESGDRPPDGHLNAGRQAFEEIEAVMNLDPLALKPESVWRDRLIVGDATETMPRFLADNPHLVVSLLFLDFDIYEPTKVALETFVPRMPRGAVIAFDELNSPDWPGESLALEHVLGIRDVRLRRLEPYIGISYAVLGE